MIMIETDSKAEICLIINSEYPRDSIEPVNPLHSHLHFAHPLAILRILEKE